MLQQWQTHVQITVATFTQAVETFTYAMTVTFKNSGDWNLHSDSNIKAFTHNILQTAIAAFCTQWHNFYALQQQQHDSIYTQLQQHLKQIVATAFAYNYSNIYTRAVTTWQHLHMAHGTYQ